MTTGIICGLNMEMEIAEEMGWVGKCRGCLHNEYYYTDDEIYCNKKQKTIPEQTDCPLWVCDHR